MPCQQRPGNLLNSRVSNRQINWFWILWFTPKNGNYRSKFEALLCFPFLGQWQCTSLLGAEEGKRSKKTASLLPKHSWMLCVQRSAYSFNGIRQLCAPMSSPAAHRAAGEKLLATELTGSAGIVCSYGFILLTLHHILLFTVMGWGNISIRLSRDPHHSPLSLQSGTPHVESVDIYHCSVKSVPHTEGSIYVCNTIVMVECIHCKIGLSFLNRLATLDT